MKTFVDLIEGSGMKVEADLSALAELSKKHQIKLHVFDVEHSGYIAGGSGAGLIEFASILATEKGNIYGFRNFINPECDITYFAMKAHGYSKSKVVNFKPWPHCATPLNNLLRYSINVGYAVSNDTSVVRKQNDRYGITSPKMTELDLLKVWMNGSGTKSGKLGKVAAEFGLNPDLNTHKAWDDTVLTAQLMNAMIADPKFMKHIESRIEQILFPPRKKFASPGMN